ncbi:MAG: NUDIX domain-containing protein [Proteobacteria bacterium]|nr:NUDIX domain-containing protein [Pseudomonadota bacterium]
MGDSIKSFEVSEETPVYEGFFKMTRIRLRHTLFRGGWSRDLIRELFYRGACVAVLPYDPVSDAIVLIEQFRIGALYFKADPWLLEIVAGAVEEGESPDQVAHREALEEAGCEIKHLLKISEFFTSPGAFGEKITLFCGIVDSSLVGGVYGLVDEDEDIRVQVVGFDEAWGMLENGSIDSAIPMIALQWLAMNRERLRAEFNGD